MNHEKSTPPTSESTKTLSVAKTLEVWIKDPEKHEKELNSLHTLMDKFIELEDLATMFERSFEHVSHEAATSDDCDYHYKRLADGIKEINEVLKNLPDQIEI